MDISKEEFDEQFQKVLDGLLEGLALHQEIDVKQFYNMTYFLENLAFFSPVIFDIIKESQTKNKPSK
ncbi:MAG: hypothetical protein M3512_03925 [Bacteroidota bacterium]|nr:hypothetical protein [Bacteroidota bacterium]